MSPNQIERTDGFTYVGLLFILVILGINLTLAATLYSFSQQREKEQQLIFIGNQFKNAIAYYYQRSPGTIKHYPQRLEDLLLDNRFVNMQRYLRKIYYDPFTKTKEWGLVKAPDGGIMGIYSLSTDKPLKATNFDLFNLELEIKKSYADWKFTYLDNLVQNRIIEGSKGRELNAI